MISVAVAQIDRDPVVRNRHVDSSLEISIAYIEKIIALKHAARRYPVTRENVEDLAANVLIGGSVKHRRALSASFLPLFAGVPGSAIGLLRFFSRRAGLAARFRAIA
jgi:hypothetical protein